MKNVSLSDFSGRDNREVFANAMAFLRENEGTCLYVEPGVYHISTPDARAAQAKVMSGAFSADPQSVMFRPEYKYDIGIDIRGIKSCEVRADGAILMIDGFMEPICISECEDVLISGFTVRHKRKPYSRGKVLSSALTDDGTYRSLIEFDEDCPIEAGTPLSLRVLYYDDEAQEPYLTDFKRAEFIDERRIYSYDTSEKEIRAGLEYYSCHTYHSRPAVMIEESKRVTLSGITVNNSCGMGFLGHRCEDLTLDGCCVTPVDNDRMSTNTDASHFTSIKGELRLSDCLFEYHGDDFSNIHGYYQRILSKVGECTYTVCDRTPTGIHAQVIDYPDIGDTMELTDLTTLQVLGTYTVTACEPMLEGKWQVKLTLDRPLPEEFEGLDLMNITRLPRVRITGCSSLDHYARSLVIKSRDVLIENCYFRNVRETAITAYAEPYWGEGALPSRITVRGCRFEDCGWARGNVSAILASVPVHKRPLGRIQSITVENNIISSSLPHAMRFCCVDGLLIRGNICKVSGEPLVIEGCTDVNIEK